MRTIVLIEQERHVFNTVDKALIEAFTLANGRAYSIEIYQDNIYGKPLVYNWEKIHSNENKACVG